MDCHVRQSKEGIWKENRHNFQLEGEHSWYLAYLIKFSVFGNKLESIYLVKRTTKNGKRKRLQTTQNTMIGGWEQWKLSFPVQNLATSAGT